jgi:hypothetical protein
MAVLVGASSVLLFAGVSLAQMGEVTFTEGYDSSNHTLTYKIEGSDVTTVSRVVDVGKDSEPSQPVPTEDPLVNHGQVVSSFVGELHDQGIHGAGCLIRIIAQSDYGKVDAAPTVTVPNVNEVSCGKPEKESGDAPGNSDGNSHGNSHGNNSHGAGGG